MPTLIRSSDGVCSPSHIYRISVVRRALGLWLALALDFRTGKRARLGYAVGLAASPRRGLLGQACGSSDTGPARGMLSCTRSAQMPYDRRHGWQRTLLLAVLLAACSHDESAVAPATDRRGEDDRALACKQMAGDAERRLAESTESVSPSTAVVVTRRNHEQICLQEASCLGIKEPAVGPFLQHCLAAAEHGAGSN